jgi:hypothetical protein
MTIVIESTSSNAGLVDPYGGLHHRTTTTTRAANSPEHDNCSPVGGENDVKLVAPKNISSSSPQRCHLVAFQRKDNNSSNNNNIIDNDDDERKGHPAVSTAPVGGARRRIGNYFAILLSSLVSILLFFPRSLCNQLYSYPNNFNDGKSKINQLQQQQQFSHLKRCRLLFIMVAVIIATILLVGEEDRRSHSIIQSSLLSSALQQCSSSSSIQQQQRATNNINSNNKSSSSNKYILVASHLRAGSDGQLRLRIIEHNLRMLSYSSSSSSSIRPQQQHYPSSVLDEDDHASEKTVLAKRNNEEEDVPPSTKKMECILIFSIDETYNTTIHAMVQTWKNSILSSSSSSNNIISQNMNITILYVPNDNIMVDASKWMMALYSLLPTLLLQLQLQQQDYYSSTRIMLINDSFLLTRPIPELWNNNICGSVCGLVWTGPNNGSDHTRHIQSYIRTLDICAIIKYMNFYERNKLLVHNVNELIVLFEINLDWAHDDQQQQQQQSVDGSNSWWSSNSLLRGSSSSSNRIGGDNRKEEDNNNNRDVTALYEFAGGHPDDEHVQHVLLTKNYPAIKLKKFFITNDPWLFAVLANKEKLDNNNNGTTTTTSLEKEMDEEDLPPSFSTTIYRRTNHDLNHLSDNDLRTHFRTSGKYENRIYSNTLPLVMKGWLRTELERMEKEYNNNYSIGDDVQVRQTDTTIAILDDYLVALNRDILGK